MDARKALICGLAGTDLSAAEARFLAAHRPAGLILFARNCVSPAQIRSLIADALTALGDSETLVLIDQEGGRVQRLRPPHWRSLPPARAFGALAETDAFGAQAAARAVARLTAQDLRGLGITMNCAPVADLPVAGAHDIIGDRAYGESVEGVVRLARAVTAGYVAGGVVPVVKHIPGHGRARADSHLELPVVDTPLAELEATDFATFRQLADAPAAMTAHVVYSAIDPGQPASTSAGVISRVVRGHIGFGGLLMSDDLGMRALSGGMAERAEAVIAAGCDLALHCSADLAEMTAAADATPRLTTPSSDRLERCLAITRQQLPFDAIAAERQLAAVAATWAERARGKPESV